MKISRRPVPFLSLVLSLALTLGACAPLPPPEPSLPKTPQSQLVVTDQPLAADAGREMLRRGGTAVDAAVATEAVLALVEPESTGFGGGGFLVSYDAKTGAINTYDGRETAPKAATPDMFLKPDGTPMKFYSAVFSGRSVGVPGQLRMLKLAHDKHGKLKWAELFQPAIRLAETGFPVSKRLAADLAKDKYLRKVPASRAYFYPGGTAPKAGDILRNPAFAKVLKAVAEEGPKALYEGKIAEDIVHAVNTAPHLPQKMTLADLKDYKAKSRAPVCAPYRQWLVCGMGPPSSGGLATLQILGMLQHFDLAEMKPFGAKAVHLIAEASARAFADRAVYVADPAFIPVPVGGMLDPQYLELRAKEIDPNHASGEVSPGMPGISASYAPDTGTEGLTTTHVSIMDKAGNAVSLTSTVEQAFGSRLMADGMLLNNELTDFSFRPEKDGAPVANAVAPGKRPRSTMAPTIVFDGRGRPVLVVGTPGGPHIVGFVVKTIIAVLDWGMTPQQAVAAPNFDDRNTGAIEIERGSKLEAIVPALEAMGHKIRRFTYASGINAIQVTPAGLVAGADPRRGGVARGD